MYLKSSDISSFIGNVDAMLLFLEEVLQHVGVEHVVQIITYSTSSMKLVHVDAMLLFLEEVLQHVGVEHVVQIITYSTSSSMELVGKRLMEKYKHVFWSVSASTCIELMLEKFRTMSCVANVLGNARIIIEFVRNHANALKPLEDSVCILSLVRPSKIRSIVPYVTLDRIVSKKENLKTFFASNSWKASEISSLTEGKQVAGLAKGKIKLGFNDKESHYMPFWREIDDVWKYPLHVSLHSAGCFLNPKYLESSSSDPNTVEDMNHCMIRMGGDSCVQDFIKLQSEKYQAAQKLTGKDNRLLVKIPATRQCIFLQKFGGHSMVQNILNCRDVPFAFLARLVTVPQSSTSQGALQS